MGDNRNAPLCCLIQECYRTKPTFFVPESCQTGIRAWGKGAALESLCPIVHIENRWLQMPPCNIPIVSRSQSHNCRACIFALVRCGRRLAVDQLLDDPHPPHTHSTL